MTCAEARIFSYAFFSAFILYNYIHSTNEVRCAEARILSYAFFDTFIFVFLCKQ